MPVSVAKGAFFFLCDFESVDRCKNKWDSVVCVFCRRYRNGTTSWRNHERVEQGLWKKKNIWQLCRVFWRAVQMIFIALLCVPTPLLLTTSTTLISMPCGMSSLALPGSRSMPQWSRYTQIRTPSPAPGRRRAPCTPPARKPCRSTQILRQGGNKNKSQKHVKSDGGKCNCRDTRWLVG